MAVVCNPIRMGRWSELMVMCVCHSDEVMREVDQGLPNLIGRWLPSGQPSIAIWLPDNDWWLPNMARHEMVTFGG